MTPAVITTATAKMTFIHNHFLAVENLCLDVQYTATPELDILQMHKITNKVTKFMCIPYSCCTFSVRFNARGSGCAGNLAS